MKELRELTEVYEKVFPSYFTEMEIKEKLFELNLSGEVFYHDEEGEETFNVNETEITVIDSDTATCEGYFYIYMPKYKEEILVCTKTWLYGYDEEEKEYTMLSDEIIGWE